MGEINDRVNAGREVARTLEEWFSGKVESMKRANIALAFMNARGASLDDASEWEWAFHDADVALSALAELEKPLALLDELGDEDGRSTKAGATEPKREWCCGIPGRVAGHEVTIYTDHSWKCSCDDVLYELVPRHEDAEQMARQHLNEAKQS